MAKISEKIKSQARHAARHNPAAYDESGSRKRKKTFSFPFSEGSLVSFRKTWQQYDVQCQSGTVCLITKGPYRCEWSRKDVVDAMIDGQIVEGVPAKILLTVDS